MKKNLLIMGNYGKEFHLYTQYYKNSKKYHVSLFTSKNIDQLFTYPCIFAGSSYPAGIPILPELELAKYLEKYYIDEVVFAGSDVSYEWISQKEKLVREYEADFRLSEVERIMLPCSQKSIAVCNIFPNEENFWLVEEISKYFFQKKLLLSWGDFPNTYQSLLSPEANIYQNPTELENQLAINPIFSNFLSLKHKIIIGGDWSRVIDLCGREGDVTLVCRQGNDLPIIKPNIYITVLDVNRDDYTHYYPGRINLELANFIVLHGYMDKEKEFILKKEIENLNPCAQIINSDHLEKLFEVF